MSGNRYLLDTNIIIGMYQRNSDVFALLSASGARLDDSGYSSVTRIELLGYPGMTATEETALTALLDQMQDYPLSRAVADAAITIRRARRVKLPDAVIAGTASAHQLTLLTLDKDLAAWVGTGSV